MKTAKKLKTGVDPDSARNDWTGLYNYAQEQGWMGTKTSAWIARQYVEWEWIPAEKKDNFLSSLRAYRSRMNLLPDSAVIKYGPRPKKGGAK